MRGEIRWGELLEPTNDKGPYKIAKIQSDGKEMDVTIVEPYGVQGSPVEKSQVMMFIPDGDEGKAVGLVLPPPDKRVNGQKEGELTLKNHKAGQTIVLSDDGTATIKADKIVLDAATIVLSGDIKLGSEDASRELALKDTTTTDGAKNSGNLATKVWAE